MTLRYYAGTFSNGNIDINNPLPVIDVSDSISCDINGVQKAVIKIARDKLPTKGYWRSGLTRLDTMIVLLDDDQPWNSPDAVLFAGYLATVPAVIGESLTLSVNGLREYWSLRIINKVYNATVTDPATQYDYVAGTWQGVLNALITECHSPAGIPNDAAKPPFILGNVSGSVSGTTYDYPVKLTNSKKYIDVIDDIRDGASLAGNEYRLVPRLTSPSRNNIAIDAVIAPDNNPHINEDQTFNVQLSNDVTANSGYKILGFELSQDGTNYFNRIVSQSVAGNSTTDSDLTTKTIIGGPTYLVDSFFNPNVQGGLTASQMAEQNTARLNLGIQQELTGTFTISGNQAEWLARLGTMLDFQTQAGVSDGFDGQMRFTDIKFSASDNKITIGCMTKKARYPKLPNTAPSSYNSNNGNVVPPNKGGIPPADTSGGTPAGKTPDDGFKTGVPPVPLLQVPFDHGIFVEGSGVANDAMMNQFNVWGPNTNQQYGNYWQGPEGITVIPNPIDARFYGLGWVANVTKKDRTSQRLVPADLNVFSTAKFNDFPKSHQGTYGGYVLDSNGTTGLGNLLGTITGPEIFTELLSDTPSDSSYELRLERIASGMVIVGPAGKQSIIVYLHQLQLFTIIPPNVAIGTLIQSKSFAFKADIVSDGDSAVISSDGFKLMDASPWEVTGDSTFYATPLQIETYGDSRQFIAMCNPSQYPKQAYFDVNWMDNTNIFADYWDRIYQGPKAISSQMFVYNFDKKTMNITSAPESSMYQTSYLSEGTMPVNTAYQIKAHKNEFWAVNLTNEYYWAGIWVDQGLSSEYGVYTRFLWKAQMNVDGTPKKWEPLVVDYALDSDLTVSVGDKVRDRVNKPIDIFRISAWKDIIQVGGWATEGVQNHATKMPDDWDGQQGVIGARSGTNAARVLYNSKNPGMGYVADAKEVTTMHFQAADYGQSSSSYPYLDFHDFSILLSTDSINGYGDHTLNMWMDCGNVILPIWNIGTADYQTVGGSHNGKFLELDNMIVSHPPTMSYLFPNTRSINQQTYDAYLSWVWRK